MSALLKMNADQLERLAKALQQMTKLSRDLNVRLGAYGPVDVAIDGNVVKVAWDEEINECVIDDRVGD